MLIYYYIAINSIAFVIAGIDKLAAIRHSWRVSEKMLFFLAFIGGAIGLFAAMLMFRHKTKHGHFMIGLPLIIIGQILVILYFKN